MKNLLIDPISQTGFTLEKPLLTLVVAAYNQERFIEEAVAGAFSQTYSPLEVILSDDSSKDATFQIMQRMAADYRGCHRIILNRNESNLGIGGHVNRIMQLAKGQIIIAAAGDDISLPNRVEKIYQAYESSNSTAKSIFSNARIIDDMGNPKGLYFPNAFSPADFMPKLIAKRDFILIGATHAWSRDAFDLFGPLLTPLTCEDMAIPFRSALLGCIRYIDEPLVIYRSHQDNVWKHPGRDVVGWEKFLVYEKQSIYKNWLQDLQKNRELVPDENNEIGDIQGIVLNRLMAVEEDIELIAGSYARKLKVIFRAIRRGDKFQTLRHRIGVFVVPNIYRYYLKYKGS